MEFCDEMSTSKMQQHHRGLFSFYAFFCGEVPSRDRQNRFLEISLISKLWSCSTRVYGHQGIAMATCALNRLVE